MAKAGVAATGEADGAATAPDDWGSGPASAAGAGSAGVAPALSGAGGVVYMYVFAQTLVVLAQGVLVGSQGPPLHCSVQSQPVQLSITLAGAPAKNQLATAVCSEMLLTVNWKKSSLEERHWARG